MLTIPQTLPIKRMAMYGSTAMLVGFTSTLIMLRQFVPKDSPSGVAVVETINKKPSTSNGAPIETKQADSRSTASVSALPDQGVLIVRNAGLPSQQYSRVSTATPTYTAPTCSTVSAPAPVASAPVGGDSGSVVSPQPTTTQPTALIPSSGEVNLQDTITNTNVIDINKVTLP